MAGKDPHLCPTFVEKMSANEAVPFEGAKDAICVRFVN